MTNCPGEEVRLNLDYSSTSVNSNGRVPLVRELGFFRSRDLLGAGGGAISVALAGGDAGEPRDIDQNGFNNPCVVILKSVNKIDQRSITYVMLRVAGVSPPLALKLSENKGGVRWGRFRLELDMLKKLEVDSMVAEGAELFVDFNSKLIKRDSLFYLVDGQLVRILQLDESRSEVQWEAALDFRNLFDSSFNRLLKPFFVEKGIGSDYSIENARKLAELDGLLSREGGIEWINPAKLVLLGGINPLVETDE